MPVADISVQGARAGVSLPLTNLAQGVVQPEFVMKLLYPLARVGEYGGATIRFDDSVYDAVIDNRADGSDYPEVQSAYSGGTYKLDFGGLSYLVPAKRKAQMISLGMNPGEIAVGQLVNKAALAHEIQCATVATTLATYATTNRVTLTSGNRFSDSAVDPDAIIRTGKTAIVNQMGLEPNVMILGRSVFDVLCSRYSRNFTTTMATNGPGLRQQLNVDDLANIFGFRRVAICDAIVNQAGGTRGKVFGNHVVMARTNDLALNADSLPYKPQGMISTVQPSFGYTYVLDGHPQILAPWEDKKTRSDVYQIDFDRQVQTVGTNSAGEATYGYFIQTAV
jgi:hypothetical protein